MVESSLHQRPLHILLYFPLHLCYPLIHCAPLPHYTLFKYPISPHLPIFNLALQISNLFLVDSPVEESTVSVYEVFQLLRLFRFLEEFA